MVYAGAVARNPASDTRARSLSRLQVILHDLAKY